MFGARVFVKAASTGFSPQGAVIVGKLLEGDPNSNIGYNAATGVRLTGFQRQVVS